MAHLPVRYMRSFVEQRLDQPWASGSIDRRRAPERFTGNDPAYSALWCALDAGLLQGNGVAQGKGPPFVVEGGPSRRGGEDCRVEMTAATAGLRLAEVLRAKLGRFAQAV